MMTTSIINSTDFSLALSQVMSSHLALSQLQIATATEKKHGSTVITWHSTCLSFSHDSWHQYNG